MTSSTDVLPSRQDSDHSSSHLTHSSHSSPLKVSAEVQDEIEELHQNVPQVEQHFSIINKIGSGTFSSVFAARIKNHSKSKVFALKHIIPTSHPSRIENELRCLQRIGGVDNVMGVEACFRHRDHVIIVMPFFQHSRFQDYVKELSVSEVRDYMYNLLLALARVHQMDIIHRDVKPSNFLYNRKLSKFALVDFGLAQKAPVATTTETTTDTRRRTRAQCSEKSSPRKRKLVASPDENVPQSPRKKRLTSPQHKLMELNTNATHSDDSKPAGHPPKKSEQISEKKMPNSHHSRTIKSPRRAVLSRNVLKKQQDGLESLKKCFGNKDRMDPPKKAVIVTSGNGGRQMYKTVAPSQCQCFGKPTICSVCMSRSSQHAPRAGTPGFRAPEVLLRCPDQTPAVDVWSAGVIFLSLLSGHYPFFRAPDDLTALGQIISVFGTEAMQTAALTYGKSVLTSPRRDGYDLQKLCQTLRGNIKTDGDNTKGCVENSVPWKCPKSAYDLLKKLLDLNPANRITAADAIKHCYFVEKS